MRDTGIRDAGYQIGVGMIAFGKHTTAVVPHFLDVDSLVAGGRITVVNPQERTDFHFLASRAEYLYAVGVHADDLARSQFFVVRVSKVDVCKAFKGNTERTVLVSDDRRGTSEAVTGDIDALRGQQENGHGTLDFFLCQFQTFNKGISLTDDGADQLGCIDLAAAHFHEMNMPFLKCFLNQLFFIIDLADCGDGIAS